MHEEIHCRKGIFIGIQNVILNQCMARIHVLKPHEVVRLLEALGFREIPQCCSHKQFHHADSRQILLKQIAKDLGLSRDKLLQARSK